MTQSGTLIGTPRYMSPEQAEAAKRPVDQRSDIYSLGATLYELLTCRAVFEGKTPQEVLSQILAREPVAPRRLNSAIPADLETVVMKAMAKRPEDRYQSAQELAGDLQRWLKLEPIHARRIGPLGRTFRWCRRNPRLAAVSAAAAIIVLILSGIYYASLLKENANTRAALKSAQEARSLAELNSYTANLSAAEVLLRSSDATSAERHLLLCPVNLRGWEWRHLWFKRDSSVTTLQAKGRFSESPYISTFAFSPDGSRIYWNTSYEVHVWNSITFAPLASYGGIGTILGLSSDGAKVVARRKEANGLAKVGVTEVSTGKVVADLEEKSPASLWRAVFSSDGSRIASQHKGGVVRIWDAATGRLLMAIDSNCSFAEALSYNGAQLAGCAGERSLALWDLASGTKLLMLEMPDPVVTAAFSPDGKWLAAGLNDGTVYILNSATRRIAATVAGQGRPVLAINFSPDGSRVVSCGWDRSVRVSETTSGRLIASLPIPDAQQLTSTGLMLTSVAFAPDGRRLFAGSEIMGEDRGEVRVWRAPTYGGTLFRRFTRYYGPGTIAVSPDSARLAVAIGKSIEVWDSSTGEVLSTWQAADVDSNIECLAFSPDGMRVVSGSDGGTVRIWEGVHGKLVASLAGHKKKITSVAYSFDGTRFVTSSLDGRARLWDAASGHTVAVISLQEPVNSAAFSPDGMKIVTSSGNSSGGDGNGAAVRVWHGRTGAPLAELSMKGVALAAMFSPDGQRIAAVDYGHLYIWDAAKGVLLTTIDASGYGGLAFSPDGSRIVSGTYGEAIGIWDAVRYNLLLETPPGYWGGGAVMFTPDGTRLFCLSGDSTVSVLDSRSSYLPETKQLVSSLLEKLIFADDVIANLQHDTKLDPAIRASALRYVQDRGDSPFKLSARSWDLVKLPGGSSKDYQQALRMAEVACRLDPLDASHLNTLGAAQYRNGAYQDALATFARCAGLRKIPAAHDIVFIAMAHAKLSQTAKARAALEQLRALMKNPDRSSDAELQGFLREAEALIR